jgi:hypothetical protein
VFKQPEQEMLADSTVNTHHVGGREVIDVQKDSVLAQWFQTRTENARGTRKTMIVALARKLLIALWRLVREGVVPDGVVLRPAS